MIGATWTADCYRAPGENARMDPTCYKCWGTDYEATGRFNVSRFGNLRRAELKCRKCGNVWSSGLPDALERGDAAAAMLPEAGPPERERLALQTRITGLLDDMPADRIQTMTPAELEQHRKRAAAIAARTRT